MLTPETLQALISIEITRPNEKFYALVDQSGMQGIFPQLQRHRCSWTSLFENSRDQGAFEVAPILFEIDQGSELSSGMLRWLCSKGIYASSIIFLKSPMSRAELAGRLARRLEAVLEPNHAVMLRYFDTRVLENLMLALTNEQLTAFLGVAFSWWYVSRAGKLIKINCALSDYDTFVEPLKISQLQEDLLLEASIPDQVAALLKENAPQEFELLPPAQRHEFLIQTINNARHFSISNVHEFALYGALELYFGVDFSSKDKWTLMMAEVKNGNSTLTEAVQKYEAYTLGT